MFLDILTKKLNRRKFLASAAIVAGLGFLSYACIGNVFAAPSLSKDKIVKINELKTRLKHYER